MCPALAVGRILRPDFQRIAFFVRRFKYFEIINMNGSNIKNSLAFGAVIKTATQILNRAGAILLIPIFTRLMTPADYGIVNLVSTFSGIIALLSLGFPVAQQVNYHKLKDSPKDLGSYIFTTNVTSFLVLLVVSACLLWMPWSEWLVRILLGTDQIKLFPHVAIGLGLGAIAAFANFSDSFFNIRRKFHIQSILSLVGFALTAGISLALLRWTDWGPTARLMGMFLGACLPLAVGMTIYMRSSYPRFRMDYLRDAWTIGWPAAMNWGIFLIINQSDRIVLSHFLSLETVGYYTLAFTLAQGMSVVVQSVAQSYSPLFMETANRHDGDVRSLEPISRTCIEIVLAVGLLASAWLPYLVRGILPVEYTATVTFLPCLTGALGLYILFNMLSLNYSFHRKTIYMPAFTIFAAALSAGLNILLVPRFGEQAAAFTALATYLALSLVSLFVTRTLFENMQFRVVPTVLTILGYSIVVLLNHLSLRDPILEIAIAGCTTFLVAIRSRRLWKKYRGRKTLGNAS